MLDTPFWDQTDSRLFLNPRLPAEEFRTIENAVAENNQTSFLWLRSSGTESARTAIKLVGITKTAFIHGARAVNSFYGVNSADVWINPLPLFHVGGLAISARCYLAKAQEVRLQQWDPRALVATLQQQRGTIVSLVPTQIFDLIKNECKAPASLRQVVVGGGALDTTLWQQARDLGWPISITYGMTETSAMIAGSKDNESTMTVLDSVQIKKVDSNYALTGNSLFSGYLWIEKNGEAQWQPRPTPFIIDDRLELKGNQLQVLGRQSELVKILGETVNLNEVSNKLSQILKGNFAIIPHPTPRRNFNLHLFIEGPNKNQSLDNLNALLMPYERINKIHYLEKLPRTDLGKIHRAALTTKLDTILKNQNSNK